MLLVNDIYEKTTTNLMNKTELTKQKSDKETYEKHLTKLCEFMGFNPPFWSD